MKKLHIVIALLAVWFAGSTYWYTCNIEQACSTSQSSSNNKKSDNKTSSSFDGETYSKLTTFYFKPDSSEILNNEASQPDIESIASYAKKKPSIEIIIKGYTANFPNAINDSELSAKRGDELRQRLEALGVTNKITVIPKGLEEQIGNDSSETTLAKNRRATVAFNE